MTALLVMAYGSPRSLDEVEAYYTHIRHGRPPEPELLEELKQRYRAIGGTSPLPEITRRQAEALADRLQAYLPDVQAFVGMKHAPPFIADAVGELVGAGARRLVALAMAPHDSALSLGEYRKAVESALRARGASLPLLWVQGWHRDPGVVAVLARRLRETLEGLPSAAREGAWVVFTAHSLPARVAEVGDPYPAQVRETAEAVALAAGLTRWTVAYQSAGRTPERWLGPDVGEVIRRAAAEGAPAVVCCPVGFVADHLEVLYDLDIEARQQAEACGVLFARTPSLNDAGDFMDALARFTLERLREAGWV